MDILWLKQSNQGRHIVPKKMKINIQKHAHQLLLLCHGLIKKIALSPMWYQVVISRNVAYYLVLFHFRGRKNKYLWG